VLQELVSISGLPSLPHEDSCSSCKSTTCPLKKAVWDPGLSGRYAVDDMPCFVKLVSVYHTGEPGRAVKLLSFSELLQYVARKTRSVSRDSKARASLGNLYALYVLVGDYLESLSENASYGEHEGLPLTEGIARMRRLPGGQKLQNHPLDNRLNDEFQRKFGDETDEVPVIQMASKRRKINVALLGSTDDERRVTAAICKDVVETYIELRAERLSHFLQQCVALRESSGEHPGLQIKRFLQENLLNPALDARLFEVISYCILKLHYRSEYAWIGHSKESARQVGLTLYKTGRTNANDGGIDFVLRPLGRYFQVTEVLDFRKYFLDIDKLLHFPITFVVKVDLEREDVMALIRRSAQEMYPKGIVDRYLDCFEEVFTLRDLVRVLERLSADEGSLADLVDELILQYKVEYNIVD